MPSIRKDVIKGSRGKRIGRVDSLQTGLDRNMRPVKFPIPKELSRPGGSLLSDEQGLLGHRVGVRLQFIEVHPGRGVSSVPHHRVSSRRLRIVDQRCHFLTEKVVDPEGDKRGSGQRIPDYRYWVKRVRIVLFQGKFSWNGLSFFLHTDHTIDSAEHPACGSSEEITL